MAPELTTGQAARLVGVSPSAIRGWERRFERLEPSRSRGGHRRYRRTLMLAIRDAMREGLTGETMLERAAELELTGRYATPTLLERIERIEEGQHAIRGLLDEVLAQLRRLDNASIVRRDG